MVHHGIRQRSSITENEIIGNSRNPRKLYKTLLTFVSGNYKKICQLGYFLEFFKICKICIMANGQGFLGLIPMWEYGNQSRQTGSPHLCNSFVFESMKINFWLTEEEEMTTFTKIWWVMYQVFKQPINSKKKSILLNICMFLLLYFLTISLHRTRLVSPQRLLCW